MISLRYFFLLFLVISHLQLHASRLERIEVAPDNWTFRESISKKPFVPFGTNYTPAWSGWAPDYFGDNYFDLAKVENDFAFMEAHGVNVCKVVLPSRRILPEPQPIDHLELSTQTLQRFDSVLEVAGRRGIRLMVTIELGWGGWPDWFNREGRWYGEGSRRIAADLWRKMASRYRGDGRIFAWSFCVETELDAWHIPASLKAWREWAQEQYGDIATANKTWGTSFIRWDEVHTPVFDGVNHKFWQLFPEGTHENESRTNCPFLYDFILFREYVAAKFMHDLAVAVKEEDPQALCTMGWVQWNPLLRQYGERTYDSPLRGPEYNVREIGRVFDFIGIHFYPIYPDAGDGDRAQLRYLELWARWAHIGKPVVLEEFNGQDPAAAPLGMLSLYIDWLNSGRKPKVLDKMAREPGLRNLEWCPKAIEHSRHYISGWLVWTFQNIPNSDAITQVCGLMDAKGRPTAWAEKFRELAEEVKNWELVREAAERTIEVDKRFLYTSSRYQELLDELMAAESQKVEFRVESNRSIDRLLMRKEPATLGEQSKRGAAAPPQMIGEAEDTRPKIPAR